MTGLDIFMCSDDAAHTMVKAAIKAPAIITAPSSDALVTGNILVRYGQ